MPVTRTAIASGDASLTPAAVFGAGNTPVDGDYIVCGGFDVTYSQGSLVIGDLPAVSTNVLTTNGGNFKVTGTASITIRGSIALNGNSTSTDTQDVKGCLVWDSGSLTLDAGTTSNAYKIHENSNAAAGSCARFIAGRTTDATSGTPIPWTSYTPRDWTNELTLNVIGTGSYSFNSNLTYGSQCDWKMVNVVGKFSDPTSFRAGNYQGFSSGAAYQKTARWRGVRGDQLGAFDNSGPIQPKDIFVFDDVNWGACPANRNMAIVAAPTTKTTGERRLAGLVFDKGADASGLQGFEIGYRNGVANPLLFWNGGFNSFSPTTAAQAWTGGAHFAARTTTNPSGAKFVSDLTDCVFGISAPNPASPTTNFQIISSYGVKDQALSGLIFDACYTGTPAIDACDLITITTASVPVVVTVTGCIGLTTLDGKQVGVLTTCCDAAGNLKWRVTHNTFVSCGYSQGMVDSGEGGTNGVAGSIITVSDNLVLAGTIAGGYRPMVAAVTSGNISAAQGLYAQADYNGVENPGSTVAEYSANGIAGSYNIPAPGYAQATTGQFAGTPGVHDVRLGAGGAGVNVSVGPHTFYRSIVGGTAAAEPADDWNALWTAWKAYATPSYNAALGIEPYIAYRRTRAMPTNQAVRTASSTGNTLGAVQMTGPAPLVAPTLNAAANVTATSADLSWSAATGGGGGYTYQAQDSTDGGTTWTTVGPSTGSLAETLTLASSTTYRVRVIVTDSANATATSNIVTVTTLAPPSQTPPPVSQLRLRRFGIAPVTPERFNLYTPTAGFFKGTLTAGDAKVTLDGNDVAGSTGGNAATLPQYSAPARAFVWPIAASELAGKQMVLTITNAGIADFEMVFETFGDAYAKHRPDGIVDSINVSNLTATGGTLAQALRAGYVGKLDVELVDATGALVDSSGATVSGTTLTFVPPLDATPTGAVRAHFYVETRGLPLNQLGNVAGVDGAVTVGAFSTAAATAIRTAVEAAGGFLEGVKTRVVAFLASTGALTAAGAASVGGSVLVDPTRKLVTDASGNVTATNGGSGTGGTATATFSADQAQQLADAATFAHDAKVASEAVLARTPSENVQLMRMLDASISTTATPQDVTDRVVAELAKGVTLSPIGRASLINAILRTRLFPGTVNGVPITIGLAWQLLVGRLVGLRSGKAASTNSTVETAEPGDPTQTLLSTLEDPNGNVSSVTIVPPPAPLSDGAEV